jgi:DNA-binding transcriptional LysR family regulator
LFSCSAASAAIQAPETHLGTTLLERVGRHIELSEAGRVFLPEARAILSKAIEAEQALAELEGLLRGRLRLWASHTIAGYWLPPYLHRFHVAYPQVELEVRIANSMQVSRAVLDGEADLGSVEGDIEEPLLARIPVAVDQLVLIVAAPHELAYLKSMEVADLHKLRWACVNQAPAHGKYLKKLFVNMARVFISCRSPWNCHPMRPFEAPWKRGRELP